MPSDAAQTAAFLLFGSSRTTRPWCLAGSTERLLRLFLSALPPFGLARAGAGLSGRRSRSPRLLAAEFATFRKCLEPVHSVSKIRGLFEFELLGGFQHGCFEDRDELISAVGLL